MIRVPENHAHRSCIPRRWRLTEIALIVSCCALLLLAAPTAAANELEFSIDVMSVLSKAGCNAGTCHGNLNGKGGFKLSLRGENPDGDYQSLVSASRGRRVNLVAPAESLLLRKATGSVPHRGGARFTAESPSYQVLHDWLSSHARPPHAAAPTVTALQVEPSAAVVFAPQDQLSVQVRAIFSDGSSREVTERACYKLSNHNATVTADGRVRRRKFGETTLIVRYLSQQTPVSIAFSHGASDVTDAGQKPHQDEQQRIDHYIHRKLQRLQVQPTERCSDGVFLRRAYLDALGRIPTAEEAREFLRDPRPGKRAALIDDLLARPGFADYWALKWADLLRVEEKVLDTEGVRVFHRWIRDSIAAGMPHDEFVRQLITGVGSTFAHPPANFYRANRDPTTRGETTARLFMGIRLQCARCHNHPFDRWTQDDYYRWAACFSQLDYELGENKRSDTLDKNEFAGDQQVLIAVQAEVHNPNTGRPVSPAALGGPAIDASDGRDRLEQLARWLTSADNELFAPSQVNFIWFHVMGVGLVDPPDDFRLTNPASHPELLRQLAGDFAASGFDLRRMIRQLMNSQTYQRAAGAALADFDDRTLYRRAVVRRLPAEVMLDMQNDVLGTTAPFVGYEQPLRAVQVPGLRTKLFRSQGLRGGDRFLTTFGKPERILACDCERSNETTLKQALVLLGDGLSQRLSDPENRIHALAASPASDVEIVEQLYWTALSRAPSAEELAAAVALIQAAGRPAALEDITWALLNAKEFLFRR